MYAMIVWAEAACSGMKRDQLYLAYCKACFVLAVC